MPSESISKTIAITTVCRCCNAAVKEADQFCQACGFPLKATAEEQEQFISNRNRRQLALPGLDAKIKSAGTTLYVLAGFFIVFGSIFFFMNTDNDAGIVFLITYGVLAVIFLLLGVWSKAKPVAAIVSGLALYVLIQIISAIDNPFNVAKGIFIKIVIVGYLIKGLQSAFAAEKIRKDLNITQV